MNPVIERYSDLLGTQDDPALLACVSDLDATGALLTLPPLRDAAIARVLLADAPLPVPRARQQWMGRLTAFPSPVRRRRLASLFLAVLLAASGAGIYLHGSDPQPAGAQTILQRAAAVTSVPNQATHSTYRLTAGGGYGGTIDVWIGTDARGAVSEFALTGRMFLHGRPVPELIGPRVITEHEVRGYDPGTNTVTISAPPDAEDKQLEGMFVSSLVARTMNRCQAAVRQETLSGVPVYALQFEPSSRPPSWASVRAQTSTVYFNRRSYVLEGVDWIQDGRTWQWHARLEAAGYHRVPLSAVPPHTFKLNAPASARVVRDDSPQPASRVQGCSASG